MQSQLVLVQDNLWLERQRIAGKAVSRCLSEFYALKNEPNVCLKQIERMCIDIIAQMKCSATFYDYKGFPGHVCLSVNDSLVHGIPFEYTLQDGDVCTLDLGATYEGAIADAALTMIYGQPRNEKHVQMLSMCQKSLNAGIQSIKVGKRQGCIGEAIWNTVKNSEFSLIEDLGGHHLAYNQPHAGIFVHNKSTANEGPRLVQGMTLAIEPILVCGKSKTINTLDDGWTINGKDIGCHMEHTIFIHEQHVEIITEHGIEL